MENVTADQLLSFVERIENGLAVKDDAAENVKEIYAELKGAGYDSGIVRKVIAMRKRKADDLAEEEAILDLYKSALGMK